MESVSLGRISTVLLYPVSLSAQARNRIFLEWLRTGAAAALVDTVEKFGSGNLKIGEILDPAIRLAEEGFPVSECHSYAYKCSEDLLKMASPNGDEMLLDGRAPLAGQIHKLPNLAKTFRSLVEHGKDGFYTGRIAEAIVSLIKSKGGVMELEDLAKHKTSFVEPIKYTYEGEVTVYEVGCGPMITLKR